MKSYKTMLIAAVLSLSSLNAGTPTVVKDKMLHDLDIVKNSFSVKYGPAEWKKEYADWNLDEQIDLAKVKVLEADNITIKDYQRILLGFFNSTQDYHVGVSFYSTEAAFLPFRIHSAQGKYYIAWVYSPLFAGLKSPLRKGDEVLLFDGQPVDAAVQAVKASEFGNPQSKTDQSLAEETLTMRIGSSGHLIPKGPVDLTVRHAGTNQVTTYSLNWFYLPEEISGSLSPLLAAAEAKLLHYGANGYQLVHSERKKPIGEHPFFYKDMTTPYYAQYKGGLLKRGQALFTALQKSGQVSAEQEEEDSFIGSDKSFIPALGQKIWRPGADNPFDAYIYLDQQGRKIGYVRIPHYMGSQFSAEKFGEIIRIFEKNTDALVLDQVNNPGGNLFYMYALAAMLTDQPLIVPKQKMTITQEDVFFALMNLEELEAISNDQEAREEIGATLSGYPVDLDVAQGIAKYFRFVIDEWNAGRAFTQPEYIYGIDYLKPHPKSRYTKPILLLVNELDFSCGDFLPAILQDNQRVTMLGTTTAGAGGYVLSQAHPNLFGVQGYSLTGSIAQRIDLNPIENLGVMPDKVVELTPRDLEEGYPDYVSAIKQAVSQILE